MAKSYCKKQSPFKRGFGVLMPIFSLNSNYGIGNIGNSAKRFLDFLSMAGAGYWQVLPLGPTGYGNSPYQCLSAFASNPYFIDPDWLYKMGWISKETLNEFIIKNSEKVDYHKLFKTRNKLLFLAFESYLKQNNATLKEKLLLFLKKADFWIEDYAYFLSLKEHFSLKGRDDFDNYVTVSDEAKAFVNNNLKQSKDFIIFKEFAFWLEWCELKEYAKSKGIQLIGDIPLYVSNDSADVWANPSLFMLDENYNPSYVAGVPPDMFSKSGQLWGNPLYDWLIHKQTDYKWWKERIAWQNELFDVIRIDHFIGICQYYKIPSNAKNAKNGEWCNGPSFELISAIKSNSAKATFIAEDLGNVTKEVTKVLNRSGFPSMKIMQFGFSGGENPHAPYNITQNTVVYTATHDNQTLVGFLNSCDKATLRYIKKYLNVRQNERISSEIIREAFKSSANTVILPLQDILGLDDDARINTPSTLIGNWSWKMDFEPSEDVAKKLLELATIYNRKR